MFIWDVELFFFWVRGKVCAILYFTTTTVYEWPTSDDVLQGCRHGSKLFGTTLTEAPVSCFFVHVVSKARDSPEAPQSMPGEAGLYNRQTKIFHKTTMYTLRVLFTHYPDSSACCDHLLLVSL